MKGSIEKTLISGITIALVSVLAIVLISIWQSRRLRDTASVIKHTNQVIYKTKEILDVSTQYELDVKNFLLTGDGFFLDSLDFRTAALDSAIRAVRDLTVDNSVQQTRIAALNNSVGRNRALLLEAIRLGRSRDIGQAAKLIAGSATTGYSHEIRVLCKQLESEELRLLEIRRGVNQRRSSELSVVLWSLIGALVVLGFINIKKARLDLSKAKSVRDQLELINTALEQRVRRQTADLKASEEKYRSLFYKSPLPKWIYDVDSLRFLEVNDAAIRNYGYSQETFQTMTLKDIRPAEDEDALLMDVARADAKGNENLTGVWRHIRQDGSVIDVEVTAHSFEYAGRKARMVVVNDITERVRSEQLLQQLNEDLQKRAAELTASNAELERFAYIASHDLQEPLRMVSSFLQLLQKKYKGRLDDKADQYIHFAVDGAERMKALILDLLEYSRVGTGKESFDAVDMRDVISEVRNIFREKLAETGARLETGILPVLRGDKVQLTQLLQNLVGNALKYHSALPPEIYVRAEEKEGYWQFSVQDNGIGIDPQFFDKIFIIFQRLHNRNDYSGTGIGLAICKKIVERHGGRIWVEPAPGKGSIFFFTLNT